MKNRSHLAVVAAALAVGVQASVRESSNSIKRNSTEPVSYDGWVGSLPKGTPQRFGFTKSGWRAQQSKRRHSERMRRQRRNAR